jgi:hypothetical protein
MRTLTLDDVRLNWSGTVVAAPIWAYEPATEPDFLIRTSRGIIPHYPPNARFWRIRGLWGAVDAEEARIRAGLELEEEEREAEWEARKARLIRDAADDHSPTADKSLTELNILLMAERCRDRPDPSRSAPSLIYPTARALKWCVACQERFFGLGATTICSEKCLKVRLAQTHVQSKQPRPRVGHEPRPCDHCGEDFLPARADARFCSGRCRVAHHRAVH